MADTPNLVVAKVPDGTFVAHLHIGEHIQTVVGRTLAEVGSRLVSCAISEFRMPQADAEALVAAHGLESVPTGAEHKALLDKLAAAEKQVADQATKLADAEKHLSVLQDELTEAQAEIARLNTPAPSPSTDTPPEHVATGTEAEAGNGSASAAGGAQSPSKAG